MLSVPLNASGQETHENPAVTAPEQRFAHFSGEDQRRDHGLDSLIGALGVGFIAVNPPRLPPEAEVPYGLQRDEWLPSRRSRQSTPPDMPSLAACRSRREAPESATAVASLRCRRSTPDRPGVRRSASIVPGTSQAPWYSSVWGRFAAPGGRAVAPSGVADQDTIWAASRADCPGQRPARDRCRVGQWDRQNPPARLGARRETLRPCGQPAVCRHEATRNLKLGTT